MLGHFVFYKQFLPIIMKINNFILYQLLQDELQFVVISSDPQNDNFLIDSQISYGNSKSSNITVSPFEKS